MIARVRIAPVEQWCERQLEAARRQGISPSSTVGKFLAIHTDRMGVYEGKLCGGKEWPVEQNSAAAFAKEIGSPLHFQRWACEHVLELD